MTEPHEQEASENEFRNTVFVRGYEPVEHVVVPQRAIYGSGLTRPLDHVVMLHAMFLMEEWRGWYSRAGHASAEPEPRCDEHAVWCGLTERGILGADGGPVGLQEVAASFHRVVAAGVVRGLRPAGGDA